MADFEQAIKHVLKWEGGLVDHPADPGGLTNRGITIGTFKKYASKVGLEPTRENLISLTEDQAKQIYKEVYWKNIQGDLINSQAVANIFLDGHVNMGTNGIKVMQRELGVEADGVVGPITLSVLNTSAPVVVFNGYKDSRELYYKELAEKKPKMNVFLKGWLNRINDIQYS